MKIVQLLAHSIEEADMLRLWHSLGHEVFSIGGYIDPAHPHDDKRPPMPEVALLPDLKAAVDALGQPHDRIEAHEAQVPTGVTIGLCADGHTDPMEAARRWLPGTILDWADVVIVHHLEHTWVIPQWQRLRDSGKRIIWRTVGQSAHMNEAMMAPLRKQGLEIVRYSPKERNLPNYAGEDALFRFYKDPDEWQGWTGNARSAFDENGHQVDAFAGDGSLAEWSPYVLNITQSLYQRSLADDGQLQPRGAQWCSYSFWEQATKGVPAVPLGPGSEVIHGEGAIDMGQMHSALREARAYLYTGTQPASYTLGLIEALMTGIPVVSIGPAWHRILPYGPELFEGHELSPFWTNSPDVARAQLRTLLEDHALARDVSAKQRQMAIDTFGMAGVAEAWQYYLTGYPATVAATRRELVAA